MSDASSQQNQAVVAQLELLAQVDTLVERLSEWSESPSSWPSVNRSRALLRRVLNRVEKLRIRLEAPLVVATFGGTGTGKSTLVNAIVGEQCSSSGRERPTTKRPVLVAHSQTELDALGLPLEEFDVIRVDSPALRDLILLDCPDPDTSEADEAGTNLERLRGLLPFCDVLIYTSTQQKYRSARVLDELGQAATGCRLLFVQTHADLDDDIREDWRDHLSDEYVVPELFYVDAPQALRRQQAGESPAGEFGRLMNLLTSELGGSQRIQIRRANLLDLVHAALAHCRDQLAGQQSQVGELEAVLEEQRQKLTASMAEQLRDELLTSRSLWERRLLAAVTDNWGFSPFASILRLYNGLGSLLASFSLFRARNSAQVALIGALQGARWLGQRRRQEETEIRLEQLDELGLDDARLREAQLVVDGYVRSAGLDGDSITDRSLETVRNEATRMGERFLGNARGRIEEIIENLAVRNSGFFTRAFYELLFLLYVGFVLFRAGKNFFYDTFARELLTGTAGGAELLTFDFYLSAAVFFVLWSGLLVMAFTQRLRRGLHRHIENLARELAEHRVGPGLFSGIENACAEFRQRRERLESLYRETEALRRRIAVSPELGAQLSPRGEPITVPQRD